ncbi:hypothetical protein XarjCFBP7652_07470 [Xanthomonas arboricola]|nr:hypothetical protein XarbCFBP7629_09100 [Xanthomonas arboricola]PPT49744.1 hypothetical protein XarjCFBP7652_07470 [Xanthomonas arboricola]
MPGIGDIHKTGRAGDARRSVDLHGPRGEGSRRQVDASRKHGRWRQQMLTFASRPPIQSTW